MKINNLDQKWQSEMKITIDFSNMMAENIGATHGLSKDELKSYKSKMEEIGAHIKKERSEGRLTFTVLPYQSNLINIIKEFSDKVKDKYDNFVVIGIGGSALGNIALQTALHHPYYNYLDKESRAGRPRMFFPDNIDPVRLSGLLDVIDIKKTLFNVITKSGETVETIANFLIIRDKLINVVGKENLKNHLVVTTDAEKGSLRKIAEEEGYTSFEIPPGVGGRFSVLSAVGLLSAAASGIDIEELLAGAEYMDKMCQSSNIEENPAYLCALLQYISYQKGKHISVMMPYAHSLKDIADWYRQLWAESLGKKYSKTGEIVNVGPTPVKALGVTDQHSQIQLYAEGPYDKIIAFIEVKKFKKDLKIPATFADLDGISYLGGHSLSKLLNIELEGTRWALTNNHRPNYTITLPVINPFTIGQLIYLLELQTAVAGELFNINTFDQPGVEGGKTFAYAKLGKPGYEESR